MRANQDHRPESTAVLYLTKGQVITGERRPTEFEGWLWCHDKAGTTAWVPEAYLEPLSQEGMYTLLRDYSSLELTVDNGDGLLVLYEESQWAWVRTLEGDEGWVPLDILEGTDTQGLIPDIDPMDL